LKYVDTVALVFVFILVYFFILC